MVGLARGPPLGLPPSATLRTAGLAGSISLGGKCSVWGSRDWGWNPGLAPDPLSPRRIHSFLTRAGEAIFLGLTG